MGEGKLCHMHDTENCEGWLSLGGCSSGGRALTALSQRPQFNPGFSQFSE